MTGAQTITKARASGFTMVELLVVIGIIALIAAVGLPNIVGYMRAGRIRSAEDAVAGALQKARNTGIMKNTQMGVLFLTQNNTTFWVALEDTAGGGFIRHSVSFAAPVAGQTMRYQLPPGIQFAAASTDCPGIASFTPANASLRFDRYGLSSLPPATGATAVILASGSTATNLIYAGTGSERSVCLIDRNTGLKRWLKIATGGRILRGQ